MKIYLKYLSGLCLTIWSGISFNGAFAQSTDEQYELLKKQVGIGWNTWNTRNMLSHVYLPEGLSINIEFKQHYKNGEKYLKEALLAKRNHRPEQIIPGLHAWDGSYTELQLKWEEVTAKIETASHNEQWFVKVTPLRNGNFPSKIVFSMGYLWNKPGMVHGDKNKLIARGNAKFVFSVTNETTIDPNVNSTSPYLIMPFDQTIYGSTILTTNAFIDSILLAKRTAFLQRGNRFGTSEPIWRAIQGSMAWNTIWEPTQARPISTVNRIWNVERGGYVIFCWDNFFGALLSAVDNKPMAYLNFIETLNDRTEDGFVPNNSQGNGRKSWDRSQPPVGGIVAEILYEKYHDIWFLEKIYEPLKVWNAWWLKHRLNGELLSWGSNPARNPWQDKAWHNHLAAALESGMDDSPMFDGVPFNENTNLMELHDVGLNSLYIADCQALAKFAKVLGKKEDQKYFEQKADFFGRNIQKLWNPEMNTFVNKRSDNGMWNNRLSPTTFYPLLAGKASKTQLQLMIEKVMKNPELFWGDFILPSISKNDTAFNKQRYWKGSIWGPLNFLIYLGMRKYPEIEAVRKEFVQKSSALLLTEFKKSGKVCENYSAYDGSCEDGKISSEPYYFWGGLLGLMELMETGNFKD